MIKIHQSVHHRQKSELILNERDLISAIDLCTRNSLSNIEIIREDKLFLRTKVK